MAIRKRQIIRRFTFLLVSRYYPHCHYKSCEIPASKNIFVAAISLHDAGGKNDISLQGKCIKSDIISIKGCLKWKPATKIRKRGFVNFPCQRWLFHFPHQLHLLSLCSATNPLPDGGCQPPNHHQSTSSFTHGRLAERGADRRVEAGVQRVWRGRRGDDQHQGAWLCHEGDGHEPHRSRAAWLDQWSKTKIFVFQTLSYLLRHFVQKGKQWLKTVYETQYESPVVCE